MTVDEFYDIYRHEVHKAAQRSAAGATYISVGDVENEIWVALYANFRYNAGLEERHVNWLIWRKVNALAAKERRDYDYFRGAFTYTPQVVRAVLAEAVWVDVDGVPDMEARIDVVSQYERLPLRQRQLLFRHYAAGEVLDATERRDLSRAVDRITDRLNDAAPTRQEDLDDL